MIRNTKQREVILDVVNKSDYHPNTYQVYLECRRVLPNISLGTVYRNLNNLVDEGLIKRIGTDMEHCRYDHKKKRHSHFVCKKCGKIIDVFENYFVDIQDIHGNIVNDYDINFVGICLKCQKEEENGIKRK